MPEPLYYWADRNLLSTYQYRAENVVQLVLASDYDALRRQVAEYQQAIEVIQSSRDICLQTFTDWARDEYGPAKHALRMEPEYKKRIEALEQALELYKQASYQSHTGHWDKTMQHGAGCPECIRARELREQAQQVLRP